MALKIYVKGNEIDALPKVAEALNNAGIEYDILTTVTAEAVVGKLKNHPEDTTLSDKVMSNLLVVAEFDPRVKPVVEEKADEIEKALEERLTFLKSIKKKA